MKKKLLVFSGLLFVLTVNLYYRSFPAYFPQLKARAAKEIEERLVKEAAFWVEANFSQLAYPAKEKLVRQRIREYRAGRCREIKAEMAKQYQRLKQPYQDENGQTYLMEADCWHWARYTENVLSFGHPADRLKNGFAYDSLMVAPWGSFLPYNHFLFYLSSWLYRLVNFFHPLKLYSFLFYLPLFFAGMLLIALYLFCLRYAGPLAAVIACLFIGLSPLFLEHSCAGWFDMDVLNLLLPFLAVWAYLRVYEPALKPNRLFWLLVSAFCLGLFAYTWLYWWFALLVLIIYEAYAVLELLFSRRRNQPEAVSLGYRLSNLFFLCLFTALWVGLLCGRQPFLSFYAQLRQVLVLNKPVAAAVWPNVFTTIAEFRQLSFSQIAQLIGGLRLLVVSWLCLAGLFLYNQRLKGARREAVLLFTVWFLAMLFACRQGIRFVLFLLLPLGIALGWAAEELYRYLRLRRKKALSLLVLALVFALGLNTLGNGWQAARNIYPLMHDSWYKLLLALRQDSAKEAVINAWWDFGDWLKTVAQRRVIFDGQSQHLPQAYWMARVLFSQGEEEAMAILRMLNNAGNQAFELLDGYYADSFKAITFLNKLLSLPLAEARQALKALPAELARREEEILFQQPVEAYFIVDYSLLAKAGPISYLANWDFNRLYLLVKPGQAREQLASEGLSAGQIESLTKESSLMGPADIEDWVSQKVHFYSRLLKGSVREELVLFGGGLFYYPRQDTVYLYSCPEDKFKKPRSLFIFSGDAYREINYADSELDFSVLIFKDDADNYCALMLDRGLAKSLLVRLYFLEGRGLRHFRSFAAERLAASDKYIRAFKIAW